MDSLRLSPLYSPAIPSKPYNRAQFTKLTFTNTASSNFTTPSSTTLSSHPLGKATNFRLFTATLPFGSDTEIEAESETSDGKFDWYDQWYPLVPVCDLDKRVPHGKKVMGMDVVLWWDRNENEWKVFDDICPHRLAPLSEGRIDQWGRLQCVYHGWCFSGNGDCKLIPQAPPDGPPVNTFKKACATVYPSTVQNDIVWFWPNVDPQYKDILTKIKPPYIAEIDDPSYSRLIASRDFPYGYEVLVENLLDPAHLQYAHYGILPTPRSKSPVDREGGMPLDLVVKSLDPSGFTAKSDPGIASFSAPFVVYFAIPPDETKTDLSEEKKTVLVFICIPVSPGKSRLIWTFPRNYMIWIDKVIPRWINHLSLNLLFDSDLYLLHYEERKIMEAGGSDKWLKSCSVPTKSDAFVVSFRKWLNKYGGGKVDWRGKFSEALPPTPPRHQLMDRYWTHVVNCSSCRVAYKGLKVLKTVLQVMSISVIAIVAATRQGISSVATKTALVSTAVLCFVASKWLAHFIHKAFHFHDYNHAFR